ncbi:MAG: PDZ domain-containing protein [Hydrotalea sp. AMD]|uniref:S41 family peptidase n=1 Tax=Hydrotalea sp. AMD TaxID=2501297 RepID=UPI000942E9EC|nr:S41 family peptidase [Hydrotalea sp. AMD]RWZ86876.1 MAG: PDZ domain-containing protein [Hydrotalea sp. AMD]
MQKFIFFMMLLGYSIIGSSQNNPPLWLRYPAISPDGNTIVFGYKGDLYSVPATGGTAIPLTLNESQEEMPVWSHDGKSIAFASDRYGNFDVFVMPANGGEAKRITFNSANDFPWDFSPDNTKVIFGSSRNDLNTSVRFPQKALFLKLYDVPVSGGRNILLNTAGTEDVHYSNDGKEIVFQDRKGYEDPWRKHQTSSVTRDIWLYNFQTKNYRKLTSFIGEDREPVFSADNQYVYYLSEKNGTQNIYKMPLQLKIAEQQLTDFKDYPVRHLSRSNNNTLCFSWNGEIYTLKPDGKPEKVNIIINADTRGNVEKNVTINGGATEMSVSPNGKEIAFVFRGEVFVTSTDGSYTKRITNTPQQERMVAFAPDGRSLYYAAERGNSWDILKATIARKDEPYFYAATLIKEEPIIATEKEEFQPMPSPDGKKIAYLEERNILRVFDIATKTSTTILPAGQNFSYSDGDQRYEWSPDSKWIAVRSSKGVFGLSGGAILVFKADGTDATGTDVTQSGFSNNRQQWAMGGKALLFTSDKEGKRSLAIQGPKEADVYALFFNKAAYDQFQLNKEDAALLKEKENKDTIKKKENIVLDFSNIDHQKVRLTNASMNLDDYKLSADGSKLFLLARFEQGANLWQMDTRTKEMKLLTKLSSGGNMELSKDGKQLFVLGGGKLMKVDVEDGKVTPVTINGEMILNTAGERAYIFQHAWRQVEKKFYDPKLHGVNWAMYKTDYARFLPHINNNYDFQELLSELLGELNASHTGGRYTPRNPDGDNTASLGLFYNEMKGGNGLEITEVIKGGPVDKASSKIKAGDIIMAIDGENITDTNDWNIFLNRKAGKNVLLQVYNPATKTTWEETVKPITVSEENTLLYKRWTNTMSEMVNKLSNGQIGYVHIQGMNDASYREFFDKVMGKNYNKKALIVDTRFNGGGWLHDDLVTFLKGKQYLSFAPYGFKAEGGEPAGKWTKPSCVLMSESNYSDAFLFPYAYRANGIGKLIGKPVPGTGTAVWWETQIDPTIVFGIPMIATIGKEGRPTENLQINPDIDVDNPYNDVLFGTDDQLAAAVKEMLKETTANQ